MPSGCAGHEAGDLDQDSDSLSWLPGDHHVHSHYSVDWDETESPPAPIIGGEASYPAERSARMARKHGLRWLVITDHGGPNQSALTRDRAYPELLRSRRAIPEVLQFHGAELDVPGAKHATVIMPRNDREAELLYRIERGFARKDAYPRDRSRDSRAHMLRALDFMRSLPAPPLVIVNHPGRTIDAHGNYGLDSPERMRDWNDRAPEVMVGMEGSPGHQAMALASDGSVNENAVRADYDLYPTLGGFDVMTARAGGLWDSMLGEGRRWWITASSDSHLHYTEGGRDFWPGEYSKTYVHARADYDSILDALRRGRVFVVTGDLIDGLELTASTADSAQTAGIGQTLQVPVGSDVTISICFSDPVRLNAAGFDPRVARVDLIAGALRQQPTSSLPGNSRSADHNPTAKVVRRFTPATWRQNDGCAVATFVFSDIQHSFYVRVRGTNTAETEPQPDLPGENPWEDLWFYGNPVFIEAQ
ncbi:MAG: phosphoesterase [Pseudomonadota bacterium]